MPHPQLSHVLDLARALMDPQDSRAEAQDLCNLLEQVLLEELRSDSAWNRYDWFDGFTPLELERAPGRLTIAGGIWVNAVRQEPCVVEVRLDAPRGLTFQFMDVDGPAGDSRSVDRLTLPARRNWRYVIDVPETDSA